MRACRGRDSRTDQRMIAQVLIENIMNAKWVGLIGKNTEKNAPFSEKWWCFSDE